MARKAKAEAAAMNVNPDDIAACFSDYSALRSDIARLQQKIAATLARYEKLGVDPRAIKHAYAQASKDPAEVAAEHRRNGDYLRLLDLITVEANGQTSFADGIAAGAPAKLSAEAAEKVFLARVYNDGYNSGLAGGKIDACVHGPGSEAFVRWRDGWSDGHSDRLLKNLDADKVTAPAPRRRRSASAAAPA
jgi:ribosome modulation factor